MCGWVAEGERRVERTCQSFERSDPAGSRVVRGRQKDPRRPRSAVRRGRTKTHHGVALGRPEQGQRKHIAGAVEVSLPRRGAGLGFAPVTGSEECGHAVAPRDVRDLERETTCGFSVALPLLSTTGGARLGWCRTGGGKFPNFSLGKISALFSSGEDVISTRKFSRTRL